MKLIQAAALLILAAAPAAARKKDKAPPPAPAAAASAAAPAEKVTMDDGRKRIESYLAQRGKKLEDAYAARRAF